MSILFLTGATVTFRQLLDHIATPTFLTFLNEQGFDRIVVQYGNETDASGKHISKEYFSLVLQENAVVELLGLEIRNETNDKSVTTFANSHLQLQVFAYSDSLEAHIAEADLVVSHGGTGSIMDTLRLSKPLVVVINDQLMDNHQTEVAEQFEKEVYLRSVLCSELGTGALEDAVTAFRSGHLVFRELASPLGGVLLGVISQLLE